MPKTRQLVVDVHSATAPVRGGVVDAAGVERPFLGWLALFSALDRAITAMAADTAGGATKDRGGVHEAKPGGRTQHGVTVDTDGARTRGGL